ncbi:hypothetical protein RAS1_27950 [Phycisphaerae bacterium RAS1]|nr:hypothetical protein RAS1_27950 [Phycisphaerae bacterium RAS1]
MTGNAAFAVSLALECHGGLQPAEAPARAALAGVSRTDCPCCGPAQYHRRSITGDRFGRRDRHSNAAENPTRIVAENAGVLAPNGRRFDGP